MKLSKDLLNIRSSTHNGSSLFTGDAGQGESNLHRWIIENEWLEAIVALPLNMFYNPGIATSMWVRGRSTRVGRPIDCWRTSSRRRLRNRPTSTRSKRRS